MNKQIYMDGAPLGVGDEVYSLMMGIGKVMRIDDDEYPIIVYFEDVGMIIFTRDFKITKFYINRDLYWQKPEIIPPSKPETSKKKVKVYDWASYCPNGFPLIIHRAMTEQQAIESPLFLRKIEGTEREVER